MDTHSAPVVNIDGSKIYMTLPPIPPFKSKWAGGSDKSKSFPAKPTVTADEVRISCRKLLPTALRGQFFQIYTTNLGGEGDTFSPNLPLF